jgi:hypothetical protein
VISSFLVIASEAKQSSFQLRARDSGLLRRHSPSKSGVNAPMAPRNDDNPTGISLITI